jgi:hypothetical protein
MSEETKPSAKAKKAKPPAVEDKPFSDFIEQDYLPALQKALTSQGIDDLDLKFAKEKLPASAGTSAECWQVIGNWQDGQRQFNVYFLDEGIKSQKVFSCAASGSQPSVIEPFLGDERKITLPLLVFGVVQRLNAQKWLTWN